MFTFIFLVVLLFFVDAFVATVLFIATGMFYLLIFTNLKNKIEEVLVKYKIANYEIIEKSNKWVQSYEVTVTDNEYENLKEMMLTKQ